MKKIVKSVPAPAAFAQQLDLIEQIELSEKADLAQAAEAAARVPAYWADACKHLVKKDRVMKRLIPQLGNSLPAVARRRLQHAGAQHRRPADFGEGGANRLAPFCRPAAQK